MCDIIFQKHTGVIMHTLSIKIDDSIYEHFKEFLKFYPTNKLSIVEDDDDLVFTASNKTNYDDAMNDLQNSKTINWKNYAKDRNIDI
jgi:N12 class adenine-specific DNA methylase